MWSPQGPSCKLIWGEAPRLVCGRLGCSRSSILRSAGEPPDEGTSGATSEFLRGFEGAHLPLVQYLTKLPVGAGPIR